MRVLLLTAAIFFAKIGSANFINCRGAATDLTKLRYTFANSPGEKTRKAVKGEGAFDLNGKEHKIEIRQSTKVGSGEPGLGMQKYTEVTISLNGQELRVGFGPDQAGYYSSNPTKINWNGRDVTALVDVHTKYSRTFQEALRARDQESRLDAVGLFSNVPHGSVPAFERSFERAKRADFENSALVIISIDEGDKRKTYPVMVHFR